MDPVSRGNPGAQYRKADLHVHTPGSYDYKDKDLTKEELVDAFIDEGLELVVAADHNEGGWYERLQSEAKQRDEPLEILPGVEITTLQGGDNQIHLLAIFPPENADEIQKMLPSIGIDPTKPSATQSSIGIPGISDEIRARGGLAVLAHIDDNSGAHTETESGNIRDKIFDTERIAAIEVVCPSSRGEYPEFPAVRSSDSHHPDELGRGYTYLKMTQPSFEGLQTAFSDPESRICFSKPEYDHGHITGVKFNGSFLDNRAIQASPNLNCLIGGKGTGKSTVIEQIRYTFDIPPEPDRIEEDYLELVEETLGSDGEVEVHVMTDSGDKYCIKRQFNEEPEVFRPDGSKAEVGIDTFKSQYLDLEVHSQGELLELARRTSDQLDLIDSYLQFDEKKDRREEIKDSLRANAQSLQTEQDKLGRLESQIREYEAIKEDLDLMAESGVEDVLSDEENWDREQAHVGQLDDTLGEIREIVPEQSDFPDIPTLDVDTTPNNRLLSKSEKAIIDAKSSIIQHIRQIHEIINQSEAELSANKSEWDSRYTAWEENYTEIADEIQEETGVDIEQYFELKEKAKNLTEKEQAKQNVLDSIEKLERKRRRLLGELREVRQEITQERRNGVNEISDSLDNIRVRLEPNSNRSAYTDWFDNVLKGSNVRTNDKRKVTEHFDPEVLFDILRKEQQHRLVNSVKITNTAAENILGFDQLQNQLHEVQIQELHDKPIIELKHEGVWKPLEKMSDGQKCTALLSIAMLEREKPLVIDQPEDMLDNEYIYEEVVKMTKKIKETRQIISATHNANMPILGDAEKINVMHSDGRQGFIHERGSIDDPDVRKRAKDILEGGNKAFRLRTQKYGALQL
ncbi:AAA family ATPase [Haloarcula sp. JP-Z28]|uniref:TrlF family AAA-like ATPase n=1 Tax=Haloarcula sp. JP-Z28 TaxID=2716715 RepID=UPI0014051AA1|nr:AAA family ATPase [Haloarcula sp. JP-Z28]NHN64335.1 AAA family ATPase [Haloarcula sp. JP-Z28]